MTLGVVNPKTGLPEPHNNYLIKNTQCVMLGLGKLIFCVIYSQVPEFGKLEFTGRLADRMRPIWPVTGPIDWRADDLLSEPEIRGLVTAFDRFAAKMKWTDKL